MNMNAVGIDISKRKSTVAILRPGGQVDVKRLSSFFWCCSTFCWGFSHFHQSFS